MADTIKCTESLVLPFSASYVIPAAFGFVDPTQFSIAVSTDNLIVYKEIVDYDVQPPVYGPCDMEVQGQVKAKLGQVKVSGTIIYRVAANGIQSDKLEIADEIKSIVNVGDNMWSSGDGFVDVVDGENNYMTVGFILPDEPLVPGALTVKLNSLVYGSDYTEQRSDNTLITIEGEFVLSYNQPD